MNYPNEYVVDITKPPIRPPFRTIRDGFFSSGETKESKDATRCWTEYIEKYREAFNE